MKNRLIDANELDVDYVKASTATNRFRLYISKEQVENAPIVEAIPIELIKKKLLSCQYEYENDYDKGFDDGWNCAIKTLLKDWENENEGASE